MILIDANLLIYAVDADSHHHPVARSWLEKTFSSSNDTGLAWIVILAFVRITTHQKIMRTPLKAEAALAYVDEWLVLPGVRIVVPGTRHWSIFRNLLEATGSAGNLTSDAHLAALAIETGSTPVLGGFGF